MALAPRLAPSARFRALGRALAPAPVLLSAACCSRVTLGLPRDIAVGDADPVPTRVSAPPGGDSTLSGARATRSENPAPADTIAPGDETWAPGLPRADAIALGDETWAPGG